MAKNRTRFICSSCEHQEPKWLGRCPVCGEWNTFVEADVTPAAAKNSTARAPAAHKKTIALGDVETKELARLSTGIGELDRVLGGGLVPGSSVLVGGEPGIGKSTLMMQAAAAFTDERPIAYVAGEESPAQIRSRADRLGISERRLMLVSETRLEQLLLELRAMKPGLVVVDSIQTIHSPDAGSVPGTVNQIKYCAYELSEFARDNGVALFMVAHVTKEGTIAGPKVVEHMVDAVLYFEEAEGDVRFLRANKNRFGATDEVGLFTMQSRGLVQVTDPSSIFLVRRNGPMPAGVVVAPVYEGTRVLMVEIQALTVPAKGGVSRVFSDRIDTGRVSRIAAVLEKHLGLRFSDQDIYVNVAGGFRIQEVGVELPTAIALYSARAGLALPEGVTVTGEVSLAGEIRPVSGLRRRVRAASELGYTRCIGPNAVREGEEAAENWTPAASIAAAVRFVFGDNAAGTSRAGGR